MPAASIGPNGLFDRWISHYKRWVVMVLKHILTCAFFYDQRALLWEKKSGRQSFGCVEGRVVKFNVHGPWACPDTASTADIVKISASMANATQTQPLSMADAPPVCGGRFPPSMLADAPPPVRHGRGLRAPHRARAVVGCGWRRIGL